MSDLPVLAHPSEYLPDSYAATDILAAISFDGQVYTTLSDGHSEARVEMWQVSRSRPDFAEDKHHFIYRWLANERTHERRAKKWPWRRKGRDETCAASVAERDVQWQQRITRHLIYERWHCRDCMHEEAMIYFPWHERRCPACWSLSVNIVDSQIVPERPLEFANIGDPFVSWHNSGAKTKLRTHTWGHSPNDDAKALRVLHDAYRLAPEGHTYLYLLLLFAETLTRLPRYTDQPEFFNLLLSVGNIAKRYFELTGSPDAAATMLDTFEHAAALMDDPVPVFMAKHSFGMAVIYLLRTYDEPEAELITERSGLRQRAIDEVREAIQLNDTVFDRGVEAARAQKYRARYALADLLSSGRATEAERTESLIIFRDLSESDAEPLAPFVRAARAEAQLLAALPSDRTDEAMGPYWDAADELVGLIRSEQPFKAKHRWHWSLAVGQFLLRIRPWEDARPFLESSVTYILKDTSFRTDPLTATSDAERYYRAFSALASVYTQHGWWFEALSLLETYRGRAIGLASLTEAERRKRQTDAEQARAQQYFGRFAPDDSPTLVLVEERTGEQLARSPLGRFHDDYELPGLSDRLLELFAQLRDEDTALISLSIDDASVRGTYLLAGIILGPPMRPARQGTYRVWSIGEAEMRALTSDLYRRPGSFREHRLQTKGNLIFEHLLSPIGEDLASFGCRRAILVTPSRLSNLPFEAYRVPEASPMSGLLPQHFAFTPSFMFGSGSRPPVRRPGQERILIVGYEGVDLPHAEDEAAHLMTLFGDRARYIAGQGCTKKRVIEELNGDYDFVHFICHGAYDSERPRESSLYFRGEGATDAYRLRAREIRQFVRFKTMPVVTLSACSTALTSDSRSNTWHGLPGSLLEVGARCIIGTRWPVADRVADDVMHRLYNRFDSTKESPLQCFHRVQDELRSERGIEEWAAFGYLGLP